MPTSAPKITASVPGKVFSRKTSVQLKHHSPTPLFRTYRSDRSVPPATQHPPRLTASARRKIFAHFKHNTLAPLIRKYISDGLPSATGYPLGKTSIAPRKVFAQLVCDHLAQISRTQTSEDSFLPPQSESVQVVGKPRIRVEPDGPPVAWQAAHKQDVLKEVKVRKVLSINESNTEVKVRKVLSINESNTELAWEGAILRNLMTDSLIHYNWPVTGKRSRDEDEPSSDELLSWLDELNALVTENIVSDTPDVTAKTDFPLSSPHSSLQYPTWPPASSWNSTSNRQSLEHSRMSLSTWGSKSAKRHYTTAAVSNN